MQFQHQFENESIHNFSNEQPLSFETIPQMIIKKNDSAINKNILKLTREYKSQLQDFKFIYLTSETIISNEIIHQLR
jgi:hypothetical protein